MPLYLDEVVEFNVVITGDGIKGPDPETTPPVIPPDPPPVYPINITLQPIDIVTPRNRNVSFEIAAAANPLGGPILYQWQQRPAGTGTFVDIPGATLTTYAFVSTNDRKNTQFRCILETDRQVLVSDIVSLLITGGLSYFKFITYIKI
jgi:hypothetical protein